MTTTLHPVGVLVNTVCIDSIWNVCIQGLELYIAGCNKKYHILLMLHKDPPILNPPNNVLQYGINTAIKRCTVFCITKFYKSSETVFQKGRSVTLSNVFFSNIPVLTGNGVCFCPQLPWV